jgi:hypothetical protein
MAALSSPPGTGAAHGACVLLIAAARVDQELAKERVLEKCQREISSDQWSNRPDRL